jgi:hypothetical protein
MGTFRADVYGIAVTFEILAIAGTVWFLGGARVSTEHG